MTEKLIVRDEILIEAPPAKVWEVLVKPKYVAQWDELPKGYPSEDMGEGSKVVREHPGGAETITTIIEAREEKELKIALYQSNWEVKPPEGSVVYRYLLENRGGGTLLTIEIGNFSLIKNGQMYYDTSIEFASDSKQVIKELAEKNRDAK